MLKKQLQEISTLGEELTRLRHEGEKDRRARTAAEVEREKVASSAREARQELERSVASLKVGAGGNLILPSGGMRMMSWCHVRLILNARSAPSAEPGYLCRV